MKPDADFDLRLLRQFIAVAECGGLSAAEQRLGLSRSTISTNLSELELRLGFCLCQRGRGGFALTTEGAAVYEAARDWISAGTGFLDRLQAIKHQQLAGELNIAFSDDSLNHPQFRFAEVVAQFRKLAPKAVLSVNSLNPQAIAVALEHGQAHIGIAPAASITERFFSKALYVESSQLYCSSQHPLFTSANPSVADVQESAYVSAGYSWLNALSQQEAKLTVQAYAPELEARSALILSGSYIGFLPEHVAEHWVAKRQMRSLLPTTFHFKTTMAAHCQDQQRNNKLLQHFFALLNDTHYVNAQKS